MLWLFVGPTGVYLLDFFYSGTQFYLLLSPCLEVIKLEHSRRLKIKRLASCGHMYASSQSLRFILSQRLYSSFITSRPCLCFIPCVVFIYLYG